MSFLEDLAGSAFKAVTGDFFSRQNGQRTQRYANGAFNAEVAVNRANAAQARQWAKEDEMARHAQLMHDQETKFVRLREAAKKGGFNPLTALGAGLSVDQAAPAAGMAIPGGTAGHATLASNRLLFDGISEIADHFTGETARRRASEELVDNLNRVRAEEARRGFNSKPLEAPQINVSVDASDNSVAGRSLPTPEDATNTDPFPVGLPFLRSPRNVDAEMAEASYGDVAQELFGAFGILTDATYTGIMTGIYLVLGRDDAKAVHQMYGDPAHADKSFPEVLTALGIQDKMKDTTLSGLRAVPQNVLRAAAIQMQDRIDDVAAKVRGQRNLARNVSKWLQNRLGGNEENSE